MKSKIILIFALIIFIGLTLLLSLAIESIETPTKINKKRKNSSKSLKNTNIRKTSGALESIQWISQVRSYPENDLLIF